MTRPISNNNTTYPIQGPNTLFEEIYERFLGKITDDLYFSPNGGLAEWTKEDTKADLFNILMDAIPGFEFPRFPLYDFQQGKKSNEADEESEKPDEENQGNSENSDDIIMLDESEISGEEENPDSPTNSDAPESADKEGDNQEIEEPWQFNCHLTSEEINILALLMYNVWLQRQVASIEQIRMKYSGPEFKFTSQANHLAKLIELKKEAERQVHHMQRLYKRRKLIDNKGSTKSNWSTLAEQSALDEIWY